MHFLMVAEIECSSMEEALIRLDCYRGFGAGSEHSLTLTRATDTDLMAFDIWEFGTVDPPKGDRCFVPPVREGGDPTSAA